MPRFLVTPLVSLLTLSFCCGSSPVPEDKVVVMVVDPSWDDVGSYYVHVPLLREFKIVKVATHAGPHHQFAAGYAPVYMNFSYSSATPNPDLAAKEICPQLKNMDVSIAGVIPTSDGAVHLTDLLAECVGVRGNPAHGPLAEARRNKWVMGNAVSKAGLRSVHQVIVSSWEEAHSYLNAMRPPLSPTNPVVFKILQGSGGEGTDQINTIPEAKKYFNELHGSVSKFGEVNTRVLIQEFLIGTEYAVDSVSRDGVHKVVDVWIEDFRPANGIFDQYFGFKLQDTADPKIQKIIEYAHKVLDATGLQNGASNTEVKWLESEDQPCLVEVNARWAGMNWHDALAVEDVSMGNNQITATFTSYLDSDGFDKMPAVAPMKLWGAVVATINYKQGLVSGIPGYAAAKEYPSYFDSNYDCAPADPIGKFLDKTNPDCIPLLIAFVHENKSVVDADYDRAIALENTKKFFTIESQSDSQPLSALVGYLAVVAVGGCLALLISVIRAGRSKETSARENSGYRLVVD